MFKETFPADTQRQINVETTLLQRRHSVIPANVSNFCKTCDSEKESEKPNHMAPSTRVQRVHTSWPIKDQVGTVLLSIL